MDRMEEYKALRDAPEELPPALEGAVARARARAPAGGCGGGSAPPPGARRRCLPPSCSW